MACMVYKRYVWNVKSINYDDLIHEKKKWKGKNGKILKNDINVRNVSVRIYFVVVYAL